MYTEIYAEDNLVIKQKFKSKILDNMYQRIYLRKHITELLDINIFNNILHNIEKEIIEL